MTFEQEKKNVKAVADAARAFLASYDEFDGDPGCCGEHLDALIDAVDGLGNEGESAEPCDLGHDNPNLRDPNARLLKDAK